MIIKILTGLVKVIFMIAFFPIVLLVSLFNNDKDTKHKKVKKQAKKRRSCLDR
jgi:preprotein translocase subunit SecG